MSAQVIMLASGKGGTGKSTVSVLLGAALAARTNRVLLVELDSGLRSVDVIAGVCGKTFDVFKLIQRSLRHLRPLLGRAHLPARAAGADGRDASRI